MFIDYVPIDVRNNQLETKIQMAGLFSMDAFTVDHKEIVITRVQDKLFFNNISSSQPEISCHSSKAASASIAVYISSPICPHEFIPSKQAATLPFFRCLYTETLTVEFYKEIFEDPQSALIFGITISVIVASIFSFIYCLLYRRLKYQKLTGDESIDMGEGKGGRSNGNQRRVGSEPQQIFETPNKDKKAIKNIPTSNSDPSGERGSGNNSHLYEIEGGDNEVKDAYDI